MWNKPCLWVMFPSVRNQQTWSEKVSSENWPEQPDQHLHVQEAPLPGGTTVTPFISRCVLSELRSTPCSTGVGVSGLQRGDAGAAGGRVRSREAAGRHVRDGEGLQAGLQRQAAAVQPRSRPLKEPSEVNVGCGSETIRTIFRRRFYFPLKSPMMLWAVGHLQRGLLDLLRSKQTAHVARNCCISLLHYSPFPHCPAKSNPNAEALFNKSL